MRCGRFGVVVSVCVLMVLIVQVSSGSMESGSLFRWIIERSRYDVHGHGGRLGWACSRSYGMHV